MKNTFLKLSKALLCISISLFTTTAAYARHASIDADPLLHKPAPNFRLRDITGKLYNLNELKGKVVVLNFWFIACKPCVNEMPVLNEIKKSYDSTKVIFIALGWDNKAAINNFLKTHTFNYAIIPDAKSVATAYKLQAYPASLVVGTNGKISFVQVGGPDIGKNLNSAINTALTGN